jgi:hypothetical protein
MDATYSIKNITDVKHLIPSKTIDLATTSSAEQFVNSNISSSGSSNSTTTSGSGHSSLNSGGIGGGGGGKKTTTPTAISSSRNASRHNSPYKSQHKMESLEDIIKKVDCFILLLSPMPSSSPRIVFFQVLLSYTDNSDESSVLCFVCLYVLEVKEHRQKKV